MREQTPRRSIRIRPGLWARATELAEEEGYTDGASGVIRRALEEYLARHQIMVEINVNEPAQLATARARALAERGAP